MNSAMFRADTNMREELSGETYSSPRNYKLCPPAESFTDLSQGMDFKLEG